MRRYEILIGFLFGTALWAVVMVLQSDASLLHQICETNQYTDHENCTPHHPLYVAFYYIGYAVNPVTLGAAATVAIAVFTYTLYEATRGLVSAAEIQSADMKRSIIAAEIAANASKKSAETAEKTLLMAHAPIITIQEFGLRVPNDDVKKYHIHWGIRNSGQGVGVVKWIGISTVIIERTRAGINRINSNSRREWLSAIEPKETVGGHTFTTPALQSRIESIKAGRTALHIVFEIEAEDFLHNISTSRFPFVFDSSTGSFRRVNMSDIGDPGATIHTEEQETK
jgi:hypothetical protein